MMREIESYNALSEQMKPELPPPGTVVIYKFPNVGTRDFQNPNKIIYPHSYPVKTFDTIFDRFTKKYVKIGVNPIEHVEGGKTTIRTKKLYLEGTDLLVLTIGNADQDEMYQFCELTNQNASNEHRAKNSEDVFYRIDKRKEAKGKNDEIDKLTSALLFFSNMKEADRREYAAAMAWDETEELEILNSMIGQEIQKDPKKFINFFNDSTSKDKALLKNAESMGIIKHDVTTNKVLWDNGTTIANLERQDGKTYIDVFEEFLRTNNKGDQVLASIRKRYNKAVLEASKTETVE